MLSERAVRKFFTSLTFCSGSVSKTRRALLSLNINSGKCSMHFLSFKQLSINSFLKDKKLHDKKPPCPWILLSDCRLTPNNVFTSSLRSLNAVSTRASIVCLSTILINSSYTCFCVLWLPSAHEYSCSFKTSMALNRQ